MATREKVGAEKTAIERCKECLYAEKSFVLQGGAGSGKTETLKELLSYLVSTRPEARVICITHTNVAADEIMSRTGDVFPVSTIHSFLGTLIKDYKKNIHAVIGDLFYVPLVECTSHAEEKSGADDAKSQHENYKKCYEKYAKRLYEIERVTTEKAVGKREYDKAPEEFNDSLNAKIVELNQKISACISEKDYSGIGYNDTSYDSFRDLTYGHDGLLKIFHLLMEKYPLLSKIIADRYDYVFIDEYQDTNRDVICDLLAISKRYKLTLGLFGDSMQAIYSDGIGDIDSFIGETLELIPKPDNYRCAYEIVNIVNPLRLDGLEQEVALGRDEYGELEEKAHRHGDVKVFYSICNKRPTARSTPEDKVKYQVRVDQLIEEAKKIRPDTRVLMLTNKAIAEKNNFKALYQVFDDRYIEISDRMEKYLSEIQVLELCEICSAYTKKDYNTLIRSVRKGGFVIHKLDDKEKLHKIMSQLISDREISIQQAIVIAQESKIVKESERRQRTIEHEVAFVKELGDKSEYKKFKSLYQEGYNTYTKMKKLGNGADAPDLESSEMFDEWESMYKRERFIDALLSDDLKFSEALNYWRYLQEETEYITMHKTKGTSIENVIVVMEEFYWNQYNFASIYSKESDQNVERAKNSQKLIYVACSRARKFLAILRMVESEEVESFLKIFPDAQKIEDFA